MTGSRKSGAIGARVRQIGSRSAHVPAPGARELALAATHRKEWREARARWSELLQAEPANWEALYRLAEAAFEFGALTESIDLAERAVAARPHDARPRILLARAHAAARHYGAAEKAWDDLLARDETFVEGWLGRAECALASQAYDRAAAAVERAFAIDPVRATASPVPGKILRAVDLPDLRPALARWLNSAGPVRIADAMPQPDNAPNTNASGDETGSIAARDLADCALQTALAPSDLDALAKLGCAWFATGELAPAREIFSELARRRPHDGEAWRWLARTLRGLARPDDARDAWRRLLQVLPDDREAAARVIESLAAMGNFAAAIQFGERLSKTAAEDESVLRHLARAYRSAGQPDKARRAWNAVLAHDGRDFEALFRSGEIALAAEDTTVAEQRLAQACAINGADPRPALLLARHFGWTGQLREARALLRRALRAQPRKLDIWQAVFDLMRAAGRAGLDERVVSRLRRTLSSAADDRLFLADLLTAASQTRAAADVLREMVRANPQDTRAAARLGDAALRRGDIAEAERIGWTHLADRDLRSAPEALSEERAFLAALTQTKSFLRGRGAGAVHVDWPTTFFDQVTRERTRFSTLYTPRRNVVLHVLNSLAPGGTELQCALVASAQASRARAGEEIWVLRTDPRSTGRAGFFLPRIAAAGVRTTTLEPFAGPAHAIMATFAPLNLAPPPLRSAINTREIAAILAAVESIRPEIVHAWTPQCCAHGGIAAYIAGVPRIVMRAGSVAPDRRSFRTDVEAQRDLFLSRALRFVSADSAARLTSNAGSNLADWMRWIGMSNGQVAGDVVPNMLDLARLKMPRRAKPDRIAARYDLAPADKVVGAVMRLEREKDPELWLEIAERTCRADPDVRFVLVGDGRLRSRIERELAARGLSRRAVLTGTVSDDLALHYALFDVFLLTSRFEGTPNALLEAQFCGCPVVAPDVGGVSEAMQPDRTGLLVQGREPDSYAQALLRILRDHALRKRMSGAARAFVTRFEPDRVLASLDTIYRGDSTSPARGAV